jgi:hypothetical protein
LLLIWYRKTKKHQSISTTFTDFHIHGDFIIGSRPYHGCVTASFKSSTLKIIFTDAQSAWRPYHSIRFDIGKIEFPRWQLENQQDRLIKFWASDKKETTYKVLFDITGRYVAFCLQYGCCDDEYVIELRIFDALYSVITGLGTRPIFNTIKRRIPQSLGLIKGGTINFGIMVLFLRRGILRVMPKDQNIKTLYDSTWENLSSMSLKEPNEFEEECAREASRSEDIAEN